MIYSMTGFGRASATAGGRKIGVEVKSLNSKQLDLNVKLPQRFRELEPLLRNESTAAIQRGKVEVVVTVETIEGETHTHLNLEALKNYKQQIEQLDEYIGIPAPEDWHQVLLRLPDALKEEDNVLSDAEKDAFATALADALTLLRDFREQEGGKLQAFFTEKIENIRTLLKEVETYEAERVPKIKARLQEQLEKLTSIDYDKGRLEQELIFYIEKLDISEEKQRLGAHLDYFLHTMNDMASDPGKDAKGKKLGFISQEMGREINTLGSKSNNAEMQIIVVKMKDELEQIKEQVLNVL